MSGSFQLWIDTVKEITGPTESLGLMDICCGEMSVTRLLPWKTILAVDLVDYPNRPEDINFSRQDVRSIPLYAGFDVVICSDGLEHFTKDDGYDILGRMTTWGKIAIIFTPTRQPVKELEPESNHPDSHKSSWTPEELRDLGWKTKVFDDWHPTLDWGAMFAWRSIK